MQTQQIGLMDCNNFFVSCERLFRPDLLGKPVAVLSSNDGCIVARSQEVKDLGIPMGIPYFKVKDICEKEGITLFSSNFRLYRDLSARVMQALKREIGAIEVYSIDEAFFGVPEGWSEKELYRLRETIMRETGIPVSIGVALTKTLAKAANSFAKKEDGVHVLNKKTWEERQKEMPCGAIWGIGRQTSAKLTRDGINTVHDLLLRGLPYARAAFGVLGERMYLELSGTAVFKPGQEADIEHKSISSTRSFHREVHERPVIESALGYHIAHIAEKLRERGQCAARLSIMAAPSRYSDYVLRKSTDFVELNAPTNDTQVLLREALKLLDGLFNPEIPYKKAGATVSGIVPISALSEPLFGGGVHEYRALFEAADRLNDRFGNGTVRPGVVLRTDRWRESARLRSPEYTVKWSDICRVKA